MIRLRCGLSFDPSHPSDRCKRCYLCRGVHHCVPVYAHAPLLAVAFIGNAGQNAEETPLKPCSICGHRFDQNHAGCLTPKTAKLRYILISAACRLSFILFSSAARLTRIKSQIFKTGTCPGPLRSLCSSYALIAERRCSASEPQSRRERLFTPS